jgi:hypothetical protein
MADNSSSNTTNNNNNNLNQGSLTPRPPSRGRYSPANASSSIPGQTSAAKFTSSPSVSRSPSLHAAMVASPPHSPRLSSSQSSHNHSRTASFSSPVNMVELLAASNGTRPEARDWKSITLGELVQGQSLHFIDGDTPIEEACQVNLLLLLNGN